MISGEMAELTATSASRTTGSNEWARLSSGPAYGYFIALRLNRFVLQSVAQRNSLGSDDQIIPRRRIDVRPNNAIPMSSIDDGSGTPPELPVLPGVP